MIKVITTRNEFDIFRNSLPKDLSVGIVPTMGNLHDGHISLLKKSIEENPISVITIFVNPKQFGPTEDFDKYPRTLDDDLTRIENLIFNLKTQNEVIVFAPISNDEIYPKNFSTTISIGEMKTKLCGKFRPTHFDGVTTVVYRLFKIINPTNAYFGQKDFQQCVILKKMNMDLELNINIKIMPIIRNSEGLALSSRNQYLKEEEKSLSLTLSKTLLNIEKLIKEKSPYLPFIQNILQDSKWDYLEVLDSENLEPPTTNTKEVAIIGALRIRETRLLDNILVQIL